MKKEFFTLLIIIIIIGCVSQPEIRYYKSYNRSPEFKSFIQGDGYKLWYDEKIYSQFIEIEKDSADWKVLQKKWGAISLDHVFYNRESNIGCIIGRYKNKYKQSYDKMLKRYKKASEAQNLTFIESDQRMVNNTPVLYIRTFSKEDGTNMIGISYFINYDSGMLIIAIACPEDIYGEHRKMIEKAINGVVLTNEKKIPEWDEATKEISSSNEMQRLLEELPELVSLKEGLPAYYIHVSAPNMPIWDNKMEAQELLSELHKKIDPNVQINSKPYGESKKYTVFYGPYSSKLEAARMAKKLKDAGYSFFIKLTPNA